MELSFAKCESILDTLPIGYYTGRRINISLDREAETSYYSPMDDTIVVSYPIIAHRFEQMTGTPNEEEAIRSMLYHEVSHAILTPTCMYGGAANNIFEDERIETILQNYYHGVNFRKQLYDIHGGHAPKATDAETAFYNAVRFGLGTGKVQSEVRRILNKYSSLNRNSEKYYGHPDVCSYEYEIERLYDLIKQEYKDDPESFQDKSGEGQNQQMDELKQNQQSQGQGQNQQEKEQEQNSNGYGDETEEDPTRNVSDPILCKPMNPEEMKRMVGACLGTEPNLSEEEIQRLDEFQKTAEMIIGNFNKKNKGGSGINAYSGVFNPRAVVRQDYRFFERAMTTQGNNKFGTCHLNLIIDCSGSYCDNVNLTNGILKVLTDIERKNRNFSMDVAFINHEYHPCKSIRERQMKAWGGNSIPANMKEILLNMQKPQTCNYNIILFDGDAICNNNDLRTMKDKQKRFSAFDMKQTTLISDPDNKEYTSGFTSTKVVITKKYTDELIKHITRALTIAFG